MTIIANGEHMEIPAGTTVSALLELLSVTPAQVAVELDEKLVPREVWSEVSISGGAKLEIVRFVGGG
jgi:sulfur carrier protein